jgi:hypothetical protein
MLDVSRLQHALLDQYQPLSMAKQTEATTMTEGGVTETNAAPQAQVGANGNGNHCQIDMDVTPASGTEHTFPNIPLTVSPSPE